MKLLGFFVVGFACAALTYGQAAVEYSVGAGAAAGAAAGAKGTGQAAGGVFGAVGQVLNQAAKAGAPAAAAPSKTAVTPAAVTPGTAAQSAPALPKPIDPSQVTVGMDRNELLTRLGEPTTSTSEMRHSQMIDTFWYPAPPKDELIVSLTDGKVVSTVLASQRRKHSPVASARK
jgi:hypothetical protein